MKDHFLSGILNREKLVEENTRELLVATTVPMDKVAV